MFRTYAIIDQRTTLVDAPCRRRQQLRQCAPSPTMFGTLKAITLAYLCRHGLSVDALEGRFAESARCCLVGSDSADAEVGGMGVRPRDHRCSNVSERAHTVADTQ